MISWLRSSLFLLCSTACSTLPTIDAGECGNQVVEFPEDCDGFSAGGALCLWL